MKKLGEDMKLRIFSVFIAIFLWIYVVNIQNPEIKREFDSIPVSIENMDILSGSGLVLSGDKAYDISVKLKGNQDAVKKIQRNDIEAAADLKDIKEKLNPGNVSVPVRFTLLTPEGVTIIDRDKYSINIDLDKYAQTQKAVDVVFRGQTRKDIKYEAKSIRPNVVTISGPQKLVSEINSVKVFVDVANNEKEMSVVKKFRIFTKENVDLSNNQHLIKDSQNIQVDIDYNKIKEVPVIPNVIGEPSKGYRITSIQTIPGKVEILGHSEKINPVNNIMTKRINITGKTASVEKMLMLTLPSGVKTESEESVKVKINIEKEETKAIELTGANISLVNASNEYDYNVLTSKLKVYLVSSANILKTLNDKNVKVFINVEGLEQGEYLLAVKPSPDVNYGISQKTSKVKIKVSRKIQ